jgi:hypothetical protein
MLYWSKELLVNRSSSRDRSRSKTEIRNRSWHTHISTPFWRRWWRSQRSDFLVPWFGSTCQLSARGLSAAKSLGPHEPLHWKVMNLDHNNGEPVKKSACSMARLMSYNFAPSRHGLLLTSNNLLYNRPKALEAPMDKPNGPFMHNTIPKGSMGCIDSKSRIL